MIDLLKIVIILAVGGILALPLWHNHKVRYQFPDNKKNTWFLLLAVVEFIVLGALLQLLDRLVVWAKGLPFVEKLFTSRAISVSSQTDFVLLAVRMVLINALLLYAFLFLYRLIRRFINAVLGTPDADLERRRERKERRRQKKAAKLAKKAKRNAKETEEPEPNGAEKEESATPPTDDKNRRVQLFSHIREIHNPQDTTPADGETQKEPKKHSRVYRAIVGLFFEEPDYLYARPLVARATSILQCFLYLVEILYFLLILTTLTMVFFPVSKSFYGFLIDTIKIQNWYIYPFVSIIFLQEICYIFRTPEKPVEEGAAQQDEEQQEQELQARLGRLQYILKQRFDKEHMLRYYPGIDSEDEQPYVCTNRQYASALDFIAARMRAVSGRTVQSYMKTLDTMFGGDHIYVGVPFYSEFGEYVISYTYTRLLAGARMIFVIGNDKDAESLKKYIRDRLTEMTGSSENCTWRVYTSDERLDQADIFIATPSDFKDDNIVEHFSDFFEEVSNAIFINADEIIAQESYLCCVMASRLLKGSGDRIKFLFITTQLLYGFAASTLPKFFGVERVLNMSDATQVENVSYTLWNRESENHRIYDKTGHKIVSLESMIAELAYEHGVDGIRIHTESVIENAEEEELKAHDVEINSFYKPIPNVNFMIYSDEYFNLAAALFACTRFRGRKKSIAHIISRPYMLREYFIDKSMRADYINRASFIQPRMTEHINQHKLSLLRVFCDLTTDGRMPLNAFEKRMRDVIDLAKKRSDTPPCAFCAELLRKKKGIRSLEVEDLIAYLIAGLCDTKETPESVSEGKRAKDYYLITNASELNGYSFVREKYICFKRSRDVLERVFLCNTRVELRLNDEIIGTLPYTFPKRVPLEYLVGTNLIYRNTEYEIEQIAYDKETVSCAGNTGVSVTNDTCTIFLRCENVTYKNCLDTVFLRRYHVGESENVGVAGTRHDSISVLSQITVQKLRLDFVGETYGFYSLMSDRQTLDFYQGAEGNCHLDPKVVDDNKRTLTNKSGTALVLTLNSKETCTDGMRLLMAAVCNEFIRIMFPRSYRCVAVCPVLCEPLPFDADRDPATPEERIRALYPYLCHPEGDWIETDSHRIRLLFINDCEEDVGVLEWVFDPVCRYVQEWLVYIHSYLHWLKSFPEKKHYIYFGGEQLPACYDLDGCLKLLEDCSRLFNDMGKQDYYTANDQIDESEQRRCAFCHHTMESGRYDLFDKHRYICSDCYNVVDSKAKAESVMRDVLEYLNRRYPGVITHGENVALDDTYQLNEGQVFSEFYYRVDPDTKTIYIEKDSPVRNAAVSILRGLITIWQNTNNLQISLANAQLYYEELEYLKYIGEQESADWIYQNISDDLRQEVDQIASGVSPEIGEVEAQAQSGESARNSFMFLREIASEMDEIEAQTDEGDADYSDKLYDPDRTPRFWKRYLRGERASDGEDILPDDERETDDLDDAEDDEDPEDEVETSADEPTPNASFTVMDVLPNAPYTDDADGDKQKDADEEDDELDKDAEDGEDDELDEDAEDGEDDELDEDAEDEEDDKSADDKDAEGDEAEDADDKDAEDGEAEDANDKDAEDGEAEDANDKDAEDGEAEDADEDDELDEENDEALEDEDDDLEDEFDREAEEQSKKKKSSGGFLDKLLGRSKKKPPRRQSQLWDEDEDINPKIRFYNEIVRHALRYSDERFSREGLSDSEVNVIFHYVEGDYPELFWLCGYQYTATEISLMFRCKDANGNLDIQQIERKRKELKKGAKTFTKGITRRTPPYKALTTIYRRLILTLDYDGVGLSNHIDKDMSSDDALRSLYGALVEHKVVCAGYAVAFQYLMHSVGITCASVTSEIAPDQSCHAFNIVKIGRYCYYVDPTWGDASNTETGNSHKNEVKYGYCCVPYREFIRTGKNNVVFHIPNRDYYPNLEEFKSTNHEYHRYYHAFLNRLDENEIAKVIAAHALRYDPKQMGEFIVSIRFTNETMARCAAEKVNGHDGARIMQKARDLVARKNKKKVLLIQNYQGYIAHPTGVLELYFKQLYVKAPDQKKGH